jgi:cytochrome P450
MISNVYSKSYLFSCPTLQANSKILILDRFLNKLAGYDATDSAFDVYSCFSSVTMDMVTCYQFGLSASSDLMNDPEFLQHFFSLYRGRHSYNFYPQEVPYLTKLLKKIGYRLVPTDVDTANGELEDWTLSMCDGAAKYLKDTAGGNRTEADYPEVYSQLNTALLRADGKEKDNLPDCSRRLDLASEMLDHLAAGFETSSITLTYFVHEMSLRPDIQDALRKELRTLDPLIKFGSDELPSAKAIDNLPLLDATIRETLRLRSAIPGPEPRVTPLQGCTLGPNDLFIPGKVRVSAQAHSLHRNPEVYSDPEAWKPERWLEASEEKLKEMNRWFWAFGSGGRMCIGSNLAMYRKFTTGITIL